MPHVLIMVGLSCSGKTTYANTRALQDVQPPADIDNAVIVSADHYFERRDEAGDLIAYDFDVRKLGEAHGMCLRKFTEALQAGKSLVVVDNTNLHVIDVAPYVALAGAYDYSYEFALVDRSVSACIDSNARRPEFRRIPEEVIRRQARDLDTVQWPARWHAMGVVG
jgi:predicted kinase